MKKTKIFSAIALAVFAMLEIFSVTAKRPSLQGVHFISDRLILFVIL